MTTFTPTTDLDTAPLDPVTSELMTGLKLNPVAISEGDTTAPRVSALALGPIVASDQVTTDAGDNVLAAIDLAASRKAVIQYSFFGTLNTGAVSGTSDIRLRGSDDEAAWTTLETIATSITAAAVDVTVLGAHDERAGTSYRYYEIFATGDEDHDLTGSVMISCMGTEDES